MILLRRVRVETIGPGKDRRPWGWRRLVVVGCIVAAGGASCHSGGEKETQGPCAFAPGGKEDDVKSILTSWAEENKLGQLDNWSLALDKNSALLTLTVGGQQLDVTWRLSEDCRTEAVTAQAAKDSTITVPPAPTVEALVEKLPLVRQRPKSGGTADHGD